MVTNPYRYWWLHDGRWYQEVTKRCGPRVANEINTAAIRFVATRVGRDVAKTLERPAAELTAGEVAEVIADAAGRMWPVELVRASVEATGPSEVRTTISHHYALNMVRFARSLGDYACPCLAVRAGYFEGLGLEVEADRIECCMRTGAPSCVQVLCLPARTRRN